MLYGCGRETGAPLRLVYANHIGPFHISLTKTDQKPCPTTVCRCRDAMHDALHCQHTPQPIDRVHCVHVLISNQKIRILRPIPRMHRCYHIQEDYATPNDAKLPTVKPPTKQSPMNPPAASLSSSSTQSPAPIMQQLPRYPLLTPNKNCTITR